MINCWALRKTSRALAYEQLAGVMGEIAVQLLPPPDTGA